MKKNADIYRHLPFPTSFPPPLAYYWETHLHFLQPLLLIIEKWHEPGRLQYRDSSSNDHLILHRYAFALVGIPSLTTLTVHNLPWSAVIGICSTEKPFRMNLSIRNIPRITQIHLILITCNPGDSLVRFVRYINQMRKKFRSILGWKSSFKETLRIRSHLCPKLYL